MNNFITRPEYLMQPVFQEPGHSPGTNTMTQEKHSALHRHFEEVIDQHRGILFKVARTYCRNASDHDDLIQEMMIQIWRALPAYKPTYKLSTWLYRIALNVAISFYRKQGRYTSASTELDASVTDIAEAPPSEKEQHLTLLETFIAELRDVEKALMILYLEDKSYAEIAEITGISVSNVGTRIARIKEKLKNKFINHNLTLS